jgi:uncharacterized sulfatase
MVDPLPTAPRRPVAAPAASPTPPSPFLTAPSRFIALLPAFVVAALCLRAAELVAAWPAGTALDAGAWIIARALADDALALLRFGPLLFVATLPALLPASRRTTLAAIGALWSVVMIGQASLVAYFTAAGVPLGADLYAYSLRELRTAIGAAPRFDPLIVSATVVALAGLWLELARRLRRDPAGPGGRAAAILAMLGVLAFAFGPTNLPQAHGESEYARTLRQNKAAVWADASLATLRGLATEPDAATAVTEPADDGRGPGDARATPLAASTAPAGIAAVSGPAGDARFPFLRPETTPDALGPLFTLDPQHPPNLVFIIVEGLGRSFSGPGAELGSFTPFLDELAGRSLYFENFLAAQGRTFAILPSLLGSLPFATHGFAALGTRMPEHATLLSVLKVAGYETRFFTGTDADFDDERSFLARQGIDRLIDRAGFAPDTPHLNEWGFDDGELLSRALAEPSRDAQRPFVDVIQTITMHDPYRFVSQARYEQRFEARLDELGIGESQKSAYRARRAIYAAILYTDDALRRYFDEARRRPGYANTIFIVTGDHRLPEIPIAEWIDRYHVPLIIASPLLQSPRRVKSVSSHLDVTPSLLALLSHGCGIRTPRNVTWLGTGLDLEPGFRNVHELPMKQTKGNLVDFVAGPWLLSRDTLYRLGDGLHAEPVDDPAMQRRIAARFAAFRTANAALARTERLAPPGTSSNLAAFAERAPPPSRVAVPAAGAMLAVRDAQVPDHAGAGELAMEVTFSNAAADPSVLFVPLAVLVTSDGHEVSESYGVARALAGRGSVTIHLPVKTDGVPPGRYYLSVFPSDPASGRRIGDGRFRIPVILDAVPSAAAP